MNSPRTPAGLSIAGPLYLRQTGPAHPIHEAPESLLVANIIATAEDLDSISRIRFEYLPD